MVRAVEAWRAGGLALTTGMRLYGAAVVFEQRYEGSASGTAGAGLSSRFPCFGLPEGAAPRRHWRQAWTKVRILNLLELKLGRRR